MELGTNKYKEKISRYFTFTMVHMYVHIHKYSTVQVTVKIREKRGDGKIYDLRIRFNIFALKRKFVILFKVERFASW